MPDGITDVYKRQENGYLYHVDEDPAEIHNCWNEEKYREVKNEMLCGLAGAMMRAADPLPAPHFRYRTKLHPKGYWNQPYVSQDPGVQK